jgi:hypothetical protein
MILQKSHGTAVADRQVVINELKFQLREVLALRSQFALVFLHCDF